MGGDDPSLDDFEDDEEEDEEEDEEYVPSSADAVDADVRGTGRRFI